MGKFVQVANRGMGDVRLLSVNQSNLRPEADNFPKDCEKMVFPNYILLEMIRMASQLRITISDVEFFQSVSEDFNEEKNELLDAKKNSEMAEKIEEYDLDIRSITILDSEGNRMYLFSSGIVWLEDEGNTKRLISSLIEKANA